MCHCAYTLVRVCMRLSLSLGVILGVSKCVSICIPFSLFLKNKKNLLAIIQNFLLLYKELMQRNGFRYTVRR